MPDTRVHAKRSPHSRPRTAPSTLSYWGPPTYPTMLGLPSAPSGSSLGYTSPIRTISPQISNLRSSSRESLKTKEIGHRVGTTAPGSWSYKSKSCSMPQKLPYELRHNVRNKTSDRWIPEPGYVYGERAKLPKPSPLRIICESDVDAEYVVIPAEEITWQFSDSACSRDTPQVRALTPPLPSRDWQSSGSSTTSTSSDETSSSISISNDMSLASREENGERTGPSMISSKVFKGFVSKFKHVINGRFRTRSRTIA